MRQLTPRPIAVTCRVGSLENTAAKDKAATIKKIETRHVGMLSPEGVVSTDQTVSIPMIKEKLGIVNQFLFQTVGERAVT